MFSSLLLASTLTGNVSSPDTDSLGRVETVQYRANLVVAVKAQIGFAVHIALDPSERIERAAIGDSDHWAVTAKDGAHDVFLKPRAGAQSTNLAIRTDQRSYSLLLAVTRSGVPTLRVEFKYPDPKAASIPQLDHHYSMQVGANSSRIALRSAFDDEHFTYLGFAPHAEVPAISEVLDDGSERLVNHHTEDDTLVVHLVTHQLVLRLGSAVVNVLRDDPLPTVMPAPEHPVERLIRLDRDSASP